MARSFHVDGQHRAGHLLPGRGREGERIAYELRVRTCAWGRGSRQLAGGQGARGQPHKEHTAPRPPRLHLSQQLCSSRSLLRENRGAPGPRGSDASLGISVERTSPRHVCSNTLHFPFQTSGRFRAHGEGGGFLWASPGGCCPHSDKEKRAFLGIRNKGHSLTDNHLPTRAPHRTAVQTLLVSRPENSGACPLLGTPRTGRTPPIWTPL